MSLIAACLDTETTGFCEPDHRIVEVYIDLVRLDGGSQKPFWSYDQRINPKRNIPIDAQRVHGITSADVANMPDWETVGPTVHAILGKANLFVAHNADFDFEFLNMEFARIGLPKLTMPVLCTMKEGVWASSIGKQPSLKELCWACEVDYDETLAHAASYDVGRMLECLTRGMKWGFYNVKSVMPSLSQPQLAA